MRKYLTIKRLFAYSETKQLIFNAEFNDSVNIIQGRNTSGKSTLIQSVLYCFGINEENQKLKEVLEENVLFRLDCELKKTTIGPGENITLIRDDDTLFIKQENQPVARFNGINANHSAEHIKLKEYINNLFDFSLFLESKGEYKLAPIETLFLPYYVSQSVGWVYLRKSFSSLDFYRNFKNDYHDYYLNIDNSYDRLKKQKVENEIKEYSEQINFYTKISESNNDIALTKLTDEKFVEHSQEYISSYTNKVSEKVKDENEYVKKCNELAYFQQRLTILKKVSSNHKHQFPGKDICPTCSQAIPFDYSSVYKYFQESHDTESEKKILKKKIKEIQSRINSLSASISIHAKAIGKDYSILQQYTNNNVSFASWLGNKANIELIDKITYKLGELTSSLAVSKEALAEFKSEEDVLKLRAIQNNAFENIFTKHLKTLKVKRLEENRYLKLYNISAFPSQGVELHKTILAYHFAFNELIKGNVQIHRLPLMLDAIFKEDLDAVNETRIIEFISKNKPTDTQIFISMAITEDNQEVRSKYSQTYFNGKAKVIEIGECKDERAFLSKYEGNKLDGYIFETETIMEDNK
jgi:hypothetical protein